MSENRWTPIPAGTIIIDFSDCRYVDDIHAKLKTSFGFPDYYGKNWDALWDCLRDFSLSEERTREVVIRGIDQMPKDLRDYFQKANQIFRELEMKYPIIHFSITSIE